MKIAFCLVKNLAFGGGIEKYTLEVGSRLVRRGHDVRVYCMSHYGPVDPVVAGMRIRAVPSIPLRPLEKLTASISAAARCVLDERCDVVHFQHVAAGWMAWLARLRGQVCVLQSHGLAWRTAQWPWPGSALLRLLEKVAVKQCHAHTGPSHTQNRYYDRRYGLRTVYIPSGAEVRDRVEPLEMLRLGIWPHNYVLYLGRLSPEKGVHHLVKAMRQVALPVQLVLAGAPCGRKYEAALHDLADGDRRVIFAGHVQGRLREELLSNARIYCQPSELEGLSLSLLEAMGFGNCCLVSDIPENLEAIDHSGFTFHSGDSAHLAARIQWLLDRPEEAASAGARARARVERHYNWDRATDSLERLYMELLARRAA